MASLLARVSRVAVRVPRLSRSMAEVAEGKFTLTFTAPHQAFFSAKPVSQVNVPSTAGDFGILPNHVPIVAILKPGVVAVFENADSAKKFFVSSGTISVHSDNTVQIIAEEAVPLDHLDITVARHHLEKFTHKAASGSDADRPIAEVGVEVYAAMVKALEA